MASVFRRQPSTRLRSEDLVRDQTTDPAQLLANEFFESQGAPPAITGTGAIAFAGPTLTSTGLETLTGIASEIFSRPSLAATALETFAGTGTEAFSGPALDGTGTAGAAGVTGTGVETFSGPTFAATALEMFAGSGALALAGPALVASGSENLTGTGDEAFAVPTVSGAALETFTGAGTVALAVPDLQGGPLPSITGAGEVAFQALELAGVGSSAVEEAPIVGVLGWQTVRPRTQAPTPIHGTGAMRMRVPLVAGVGALAIRSMGATAIPSVTLNGAGLQTIGGAGRMSDRIELKGTGDVLTRQLVSVMAADPARSIGGVGTVMASLSILAAEGAVASLPPDAIDRAWHDLQTEDDELLLFGVLS